MARRRWLPVVAVNLGAVLAGVLAFGLWQKLKPVADNTPHLEGTIVQGFNRPADDVGYIPGADMHVTARRVAGGKVIYDVAYTTGPHGFRVVPKADDKPDACLFLFGDSFTFGEGVNDDQTFAADIVEQSGGRVAVDDFGVSGWGPHQLLAGLQSGRFARAATCAPTDAIYLMIPDHIGRASGRTPWDAHGPRYRLGPDGRPVRDGNFDSPGAPLPAPDLDEGFLGWRRLIGISAMGSPEETRLAAALLVASARELQRQYPGIRVHVIDWNPYDNIRAARVAHDLATAAIDVRPLSAILPDFLDRLDEFLIDPKVEGHPNPAGHARIAAYILHDIVGRKR